MSWWWGKCAETDPQGLDNIYTHENRAKQPHTLDPFKSIRLELFQSDFTDCPIVLVLMEECQLTLKMKGTTAVTAFRCWLIRHKHIHYISCTEIFIKMLIRMQWHYREEIWGLWEITEWDVVTFRNYLLITTEKEKKIAHLFSCLKLHMYKHIVIFFK